MQKLRERLESLGFGVLVVSTALIAVVVIRREFFPPSPRDAVRVSGWEELAAGRNRTGPADASVTIVEFADFQCPACRYYNLGYVRSLLERFPDDVALVHRHLPLGGHEHAYPAARAAECAADQNAFRRFAGLLYAKQDSLGIKAFEDFAAESGVVDISAFRECVSHSERVAAVDADIELAERIKADGTPTFVINGFKQLRTDSAYIEGVVLAEMKKRRK